MNLAEFRLELERSGINTKNINDERLEKLLNNCIQVGVSLGEWAEKVITAMRSFIKGETMDVQKSIYGGYRSNNHRRMNGKPVRRFKQIRG